MKNIDMTAALRQVREAATYTQQQIKMAYGVANDPRYKGGNYDGAVAAIEKIAKGLSKHPDVANILKRTNETVKEDISCPICEGEKCQCPQGESKEESKEEIEEEIKKLEEHINSLQEQLIELRKND
jgi:transcriptional regulator with XRE-family HTH domain|tara:strand:- start:124 stop:504 length:381 start_codon:yes stop_codon:yes gene_type:complete